MPAAPTLENTLMTHLAFARYQQELALWLTGDADDDNALEDAGRALCRVAHELAVQPDQLLRVLRGGRTVPAVQEGSDRAARESQARAHRHTLAMNQLLQSYTA